MPRSIKVASAFIPQVKLALRRHGFPSQKSLAEELGIARATTDKFFNGKPVDFRYFVEISERLGLDWHAIAYIEDDPPIKIQPPDNPVEPPSSPPERESLDWRQISNAMLEAQNQTRLTTNPLTSGDGATFELDQIYVPLGLVERKQRERRMGDVAPEQGSQLYDSEATDEIVQTFQNDEFFEQVLRPKRSKKIAIIGEPGAGKTTLLQKIAAWVIKNTSDVPIWISLADLQGKSLEDYLLNNWLKAATHTVRVTPEMQDQLGALFKSGQIWLLLDAVDEMANGSGYALAQIAKQLTGWVSDARVVLTCRLNVWDAGKNALEAFDTYRNLDFSYGDSQTPDQVGQFIRCWFKDNPELGDRLRLELDKTGRERIKDAVKNPLRLALLCRSWALGQGELPHTKAGLYQQFTEALYEWKQDIFPTSHAQRQELNQALGKLALKAISQEKTKFRLRHRLVCEILGEPDAKLFELARQLGWLNQVGVAAEVENMGEKVYAFYHPTFQEYFAAHAVEDWYYFLNHIPDNPAQGTYRIFEPQWKEVILLWLGREDVPKERKEEFIEALMQFEDLYCFCNFYGYRARFLAAAGTAEFVDCSYGDELVAKMVRQGFGYLNFEKQRWQTFLEPITVAARAVLQETERRRTMAALVKMLESNQDKSICRPATEILAKIDSSNQTAIAALVHLIESTDNENIRIEAVFSLGKVGNGNPTAIASLLKLIESTEDDDTCWTALDSLVQIGKNNLIIIASLEKLINSSNNEFTRGLAADSLGKIDPGNATASDELLQLIASSKNEDIRRLAADSLGKIDPGNPDAIAALVQLIKSTEYEYIRQQAADSLGQIGSGNSDAIAALVQLLELTKDENTRQQAADSLGKIGSDNPDAIGALVRLIESTENEESYSLAAESLGKIGLGNAEAIAALLQLIESTQNEFTKRIAADSLEKIDPGNPNSIAALLQLIKSTQNKFSRRLAVDNLREIGKNNINAIAALVELIESTEYEDIHQQVAFSLGEIGTGNQIAISALMQLIESTQDELTRRLTAERLAKIDPGNQLAITTLVQLIESTKNKSTYREVSDGLGEIGTGNETALTALVKLIESSENESTSVKTADGLKKILQQDQLVVIVKALKGYLSHKTYKNDFQQFHDCYKLIWHCAQNMNYPDFCQAWHDSTAFN